MAGELGAAVLQTFLQYTVTSVNAIGMIKAFRQLCRNLLNPLNGARIVPKAPFFDMQAVRPQKVPSWLSGVE